MRDGRTRRHESLLALAILSIVKAVAARCTTRVLSVLRHRVLRRLVVYLWDARSDDLIAPILFLAEGERRLRHHIGRLALRITKLWFAFEYC